MPIPSTEQRLSVCQKPEERQILMYQKWRDLLFLHWEIDAQVIQDCLPEGLTVDTYNDKAYLGIIPFFMQAVRPRFCPAVPGISDFLEINLRTYVYDKNGSPGVWFFSLDANQPLAVIIAQKLFNLPYYNAEMEATKKETIDYKMTRKGSVQEANSEFRYSKLENLGPATLESLEFFLTERYLLFAVSKSGKLFKGQIHHEPYPLANVKVEVVNENIFSLAGFKKPTTTFDHAVMSLGVDVSIYAMQEIK